MKSNYNPLIERANSIHDTSVTKSAEDRKIAK